MRPFDVYNALGFGFLEQVYVNALAIALERAGYAVERQQVYDVYFRDAVVGRYRVDLLVEASVLVEVKATVLLIRPVVTARLATFPAMLLAPQALASLKVVDLRVLV